MEELPGSKVPVLYEYDLMRRSVSRDKDSSSLHIHLGWLLAHNLNTMAGCVIEAAAAAVAEPV